MFTRSFLTARWSNLCLFTYKVPDELLLPLLAPGLELDRREGFAFVSLVAFDFLETKVLGVRWPGYRNFPEINLRFYVRRGPDRGVMFVREFVPLRLVAFLARALYNEPYRAVPMQSRVTHEDQSIHVEHQFDIGSKTQTIRVTGDTPGSCPPDTSVEHFFKEHRWGFGRTRGGRTVRYEVVHPVWNCYRVRWWTLHLDWAAVYGPKWAFLKDQQPYSTVLAEGSPISVFPKAPLGF